MDVKQTYSNSTYLYSFNCSTAIITPGNRAFKSNLIPFPILYVHSILGNSTSLIHRIYVVGL